MKPKSCTQIVIEIKQKHREQQRQEDKKKLKKIMFLGSIVLFLSVFKLTGYILQVPLDETFVLLSSGFTWGILIALYMVV